MRIFEALSVGALPICDRIDFAIEELSDVALFVDTTVHRWRLADEAAICAYYLGRPEESLALNRRLLAEGHLPDEERPRVEGNLVFALDALAARPVEHRPDLVA